MASCSLAGILMSGHSKWSTIKRKKGAEDAKRGKIFTRLGREIAVAARLGGGDESANPRLKLAIARAKAANLPKENVERAIKRGTGELAGTVTEEVTYEGYGVDGVAFLVDTITDNRNRTLAEIKHAFNRSGGSLASAGSVSWQFDQVGHITLTAAGLDYEEVFLAAAESGAEDVEDDGGNLYIVTPREQLAAVTHALSEMGYPIEESELRWQAQNEANPSLNSALNNLRLLDRLEDLDDVQSVACNLHMSDELLKVYEAE